MTMEIFRKFEFVTQPDNAFQIPFRFLSTLIVRSIANSGITPNQVTITRGLVVVASLYCFAAGDPASLLWAVCFFFLFEVLDHVDGDLARHTRQFSKVGPLLEQFIDTWSSRPSNVFGLCVALGMYRQSQEVTGFVLFGATALGRMLWLEYRSYFGWVQLSKEEAKGYKGVLGAPTFMSALRNLLEVLYVWNNLFLILGALFYLPVLLSVGLNSMNIGFAIVAILNNLPWIVIVFSGFRRA